MRGRFSFGSWAQLLGPCFVAATGAACRVSLEIPEGAAVLCANNDECPEGMLCNPNTNRCVDSDSPDFVPPALVSSAVTPSVVGRGATISLAVEADEPLSGPPDAQLLALGTTYPFAPASGGAGDTSFTLTLAASDLMPSGLDLSVQIRLLDGAGNETLVTLEQVLRLDYDAALPRGVAFAVVPAPTSPLGVIAARLGGSTLDAVSAANPGATLSLSFELSESLADLSTQLTVESVAPSEAAQPLSYVETLNGRHFFSRVVGDNEEEGTHTLRIRTVDDVGNSLAAEEQSVATVVIDRTAPGAVDVDTTGSVTYTRIPWGSAATAGVPFYAVDAVAGAALGTTFVLALDTVPFAGASVGAAAVSADGSFSMVIDGPDRQDVLLVAVDEAGNLSPARRVRDIRLVSTLGGKEAGSAAVNPNRFLSAPRWDPTLTQDTATELGAADGVATADCPASCAIGTVETRGLGYWKEPVASQPDGYPLRTFVPKQEMAVGYDPVNEEVLVFGGWFDGTAASRETWEFDGETWTYRSGGGPVQRRGARMANMPVKIGTTLQERAVLFGGRQSTLDNGSLCTGGTYFCNDVWYWTGFGWTILSVSGTAPAARGGHGMAYDASRGRTVIYGGRGAAGPLSDTWELYCTVVNCYWVSVGGASATPGRDSMAMAYDGSRGGIVMTGGHVSTVTATDSWQRIGTSWTQLSSDIGVADEDHWLTYDSSRGELLIWGMDYLTAANPSRCQRPPIFDGTGTSCPEFLFGAAPLQAGSSYVMANPSSADVVVFSRVFDPGYTYVWNAGAGDRPAHIFELALGAALGGSTATIAQIDFTGNDAPVVPGWQRDVGEPFGVRDAQGRSYGWTCQNTSFVGGIPVAQSVGDATLAAQLNSQLLAQYGFQFSTQYSCRWEYALPAGTYNVLLWYRFADDMGMDSGVSLEGNDYSLASGDGLQVVSVPLAVTDGLLTIEPYDPNLGDGNDPDIAVVALAIYQRTPLDGVTLRWAVGSESGTLGTDLYVWQGIEWTPVGTVGGAAGVVSTLVWSPADAAEAAFYVRGPHRTMSFAAVPAGTNGANPNGAAVMTDYIEVETSFRLDP